MQLIQGGEQLGEDGQPQSADDLAQLLAGAATEAPDGGLGKGPYPPGAAPQSVQGGRGLNTANTQPAPGTPQIDTSQAGVVPQEGPV